MRRAALLLLAAACTASPGAEADGAPCLFKGLVCEYINRRVRCDCDGIAHW